MKTTDCSRRLSTEQTAAAIDFINRFQPATPAEERDRKILEYAFIHDMSAAQIARLNDPALIGISNRNNGRPLSAKSIQRICLKYLPQMKSERTTEAPQRKRNRLHKALRDGEIEKPHICSCCGSIDRLELHHIIPISCGGTNDYFNLIYLCHDCHMTLHSSIYSKLKFSN